MFHIPNDLDRELKIACSSHATVLITGPTGTGKTSLAQKIHKSSPRKLRPFVPINLATLHEGVLESELFGHEKGAYTGADQKRVGKIEGAQSGTLFLDEVSELPPKLQARLLEFLQSRTLSPVGSNREIQMDVRIIAATQRDLEKSVAKGDFREDLLHRLRVIAIPLKPLRERGDELDLLVHECLMSAAAQAGRSVLRISGELAEKLECYSWPGNLRELQNVLEYAVLASNGSEITVDDLPAWFQAPGVAEQTQSSSASPLLGVAEVPMHMDYFGTLQRFEAEYLRRALVYYRGRINRTARQIGLKKTTLIRRIKSYGLESS